MSTGVTKHFGQGGGGAWLTPYKIFLTSSLITMQNLVAASHAVCAYVGGSKHFGKLRHRHLGMGRGWPLVTRFSPISVAVPNLVILGQP